MADRCRTSTSSALAAARGPRRARPRRGRLRAAGLVAALASVVVAWPGQAQAEPRDDRPWGRGVMRPTFGLSPWGLFNQDIASLSFGLGFNYFIANGLSLGLSVSDTIFIYRSAFKARYPGIETQLPTNLLEVTPTLQYVFFRHRRFSPYVYGGAGPVFFNHGAGTHGQWVAGPGVYFNITGPLYVSAGVGFSGLFPTGRCNEALTYQPQDPLAPGVLLDLCSFRWGPQVGVVLAFGGGNQGRGRRSEQPERRAPPPPASNPLDEAVEPEATPPAEAHPPGDAAEPPVTEPGSTDVAPPSEGPEPAPTDVAAPPSEGPEPAPTDVAPPPSEGPEPAPTDVAPPAGFARIDRRLHAPRAP
jgi:hypothetical protein